MLQQKTARFLGTSAGEDGKMLTLAIGSRIQYRLQNQGNEPLYYMLLGLDQGNQSFVWATEAAVAPQSVIDLLGDKG